MCGRFTQAYTWQEIRDLYNLTRTAQNIEPRYNIAPTQQIDVIHVPDDHVKTDRGISALLKRGLTWQSTQNLYGH